MFRILCVCLTLLALLVVPAVVEACPPQVSSVSSHCGVVAAPQVFAAPQIIYQQPQIVAAPIVSYTPVVSSSLLFSSGQSYSSTQVFSGSRRGVNNVIFSSNRGGGRRNSRTKIVQRG